MTGTADTEAPEFLHIYNLEVVVIPTNRPMIRLDHSDLIYLTQTEKFAAVIEDIKACYNKKQPVLVGTASIESSEYLSSLLTQEKIKHNVLNAKHHEQEAHIITQAGRPGAVTIATNMAGRGTDIVLGGNLKAELSELQAHDLPQDRLQKEVERLREEWQKRHEEVISVGGLHIIGSERHESRRIDNQLRGRAARQGDPGSSRFYLSLEDNLLRIFASERVGNMMRRLGMKEGEPLEHPWVSRTVESAQRRVEGFNFDTRKQLLEYDNVANDQRQVIYAQRSELMAESDVSAIVDNIRDDVIESIITAHIPHQSLPEQWNLNGLQEQLEHEFNLHLELTNWLEADENLAEELLRERVLQAAAEFYNKKRADIDSDILHQIEKSILLQQLDKHWRDHLAQMDHLRQGIHLRGYAQKNPKQEYKRESFEMFSNMLEAMKHDTIRLLHHIQVRSEEDAKAVEEQRRVEAQRSMEFQHNPASLMASSQQDDELQSPTPQTYVREGQKMGRNQLCPCGSNKKYKHCHGKLN